MRILIFNTGASGIALTKRDAERISLDSAHLDYTLLFSTANGTVRAAPLKLDSLQIGPVDAPSAPAAVDEGDLDMSLLGMSYLSTLGQLEIKGAMHAESASLMDPGPVFSLNPDTNPRRP